MEVQKRPAGEYPTGHFLKWNTLDEGHEPNVKHDGKKHQHKHNDGCGVGLRKLLKQLHP
jgi:hypothetical protein